MIEQQLAYQQSSAHIHEMLRARGHRQAISTAVLSAALDLLAPSRNDELIAHAREWFRSKAVLVPDGLETLPAVWLRDLPEILWRTRKPGWTHLPYMTKRVGYENGVLCLTFPQELPHDEDRLSGWDRVRLEANLRLFPNLWTPLPPPLEHRVWRLRPKLRHELFRLQD